MKRTSNVDRKKSRNHLDEIVEVSIPSQTKHLHAMRMLTQALATSMGFAEKDSENAALAVEEALTNVIEHAYRGEAGRKMRVIYEMVGEQFKVRILHRGDQLAPSPGSDGDEFSHFHRQKKKGGLGILIMKRCMDEVIYRTRDSQNECCMIKYLRK